MRVVGDVGQQRCSCNRGKRLTFLLFQEKNVITMRDFHEYDSLYIKGGVMVGELCLVSVFLHLLMILFPNAMHALAGTELYEDRVRTVFIIANLAYLLALSWVGIVLDKRSVFIESILKNTQKISVLQLIIMLTALYLLKIDISLTFLLIYSLWLFAAFSIWRVFLRLVLKSYRSHGGNTKRVVVLGAGSMANQVYNQLVTNISYGYKFMGFFDDRDPENYKVPAELVKGKLADVNKYITDNDVHIVYCALPAGDDRSRLSFHLSSIHIIRRKGSENDVAAGTRLQRSARICKRKDDRLAGSDAAGKSILSSDRRRQHFGSAAAHSGGALRSCDRQHAAAGRFRAQIRN